MAESTQFVGPAEGEHWLTC